MYQVTVIKSRPDFRVFIDLLCSCNKNVGTEGNSTPVNSRFWTDLYICDRESDDPEIQIYLPQYSDNVFEIKSESKDLEELAALYLFLYCGNKICTDGKILEAHVVKRLKAKYSLQLLRAEQSIWHHSSDSNPYPNLA
ncbi:MAG: hypothetical protein AAGF83_14805 [Cyanobacteria bacterium P01_G01_bin.67]